MISLLQHLTLNDSEYQCHELGYLWYILQVSDGAFRLYILTLTS